MLFFTDLTVIVEIVWIENVESQHVGGEDGVVSDLCMPTDVHTTVASSLMIPTGVYILHDTKILYF